jgi:hypothetical protein
MHKPTVTQLLSLLNKPALMNWANKLGLEGINLKDYQAKSKANGINLHKQIEAFEMLNIPFEQVDVQDKYINFMENKYIINMEQNIETAYFSGRYDAKMLIDGDDYIVDFKSSSAIYLENKLQLTAYKMANVDCNIAIIEIPGFILKPINIDFSKYSKILQCLSQIWHLKNELGEY